MEHLNEFALDYYLRGEAGALMRGLAQEELFRRGQNAAPKMTEQEMAKYLKKCGWVVFRPRNATRKRRE